MANKQQPVYAFILVYSAPPENPLVEQDFAREFTSAIAPLHALTRIGRRSRPEWERFKRDFPVPIYEFFFKRMPSDITKDIFVLNTIGVRVHMEVPAPCILARLDGPNGGFTHEVVINELSLRSCKGNLQLFQNALKELMRLRNFTPGMLSPHPETDEAPRGLPGKKLA